MYEYVLGTDARPQTASHCSFRRRIARTRSRRRLIDKSLLPVQQCTELWAFANTSWAPDRTSPKEELWSMEPYHIRTCCNPGQPRAFTKYLVCRLKTDGACVCGPRTTDRAYSSPFLGREGSSPYILSSFFRPPSRTGHHTTLPRLANISGARRPIQKSTAVCNQKAGSPIPPWPSTHQVNFDEKALPPLGLTHEAQQKSEEPSAWAHRHTDRSNGRSNRRTNLDSRSKVQYSRRRNHWHSA